MPKQNPPLSWKTIRFRMAEASKRYQEAQDEYKARVDELKSRCNHKRIQQYCDYEDSGWRCPDCGGDWYRHPGLKKK